VEINRQMLRFLELVLNSHSQEKDQDFKTGAETLNQFIHSTMQCVKNTLELMLKKLSIRVKVKKLFLIALISHL